MHAVIQQSLGDPQVSGRHPFLHTVAEQEGPLELVPQLDATLLCGRRRPPFRVVYLRQAPLALLVKPSEDPVRVVLCVLQNLRRLRRIVQCEQRLEEVHHRVLRVLPDYLGIPAIGFRLEEAGFVPQVGLHFCPRGQGSFLVLVVPGDPAGVGKREDDKR
jgi:hypothetical protein